MAIRTKGIADAQWRAWVDEEPPLEEGDIESLHRAFVRWLKRAPPAELLAPHEADRLVSEFILLSRRLRRRQKQSVDTTGAVYVGALVALAGWAVGGPIGGLAGPLFTLGLATYNGKLGADHRRQQSMIDEVDAMIDTLIDRIRS
ncbi:MAG TPA: hypothetical protein VF603_04435 [Allosphingosinicella sp.]